MTVQVTDVTSHSNLINQDISFSEDLTYAVTIPYNTITPTITDVTGIMSTLNPKPVC